MKLIVLLLFLFFSFVTFAKTQFFSDFRGDHYLVSFESEGKWYLDHFVVPEGRLQDHVESFSFQDERDLIDFVARKYPVTRNKISLKKRRESYVSTETNDKIWEVKETWNEDWENKFSEWLVENFDKDFFVKYNIVTDCADVAFSLRWIFARMHGLPAANTLSGSNVLFTQDSFRSEWRHLKRHENWFQDELFLEAMKYLLRGAYTGTLRIDGYPILIHPEVFKVGTIHLDGGHTMIISKIDFEGTTGAPIWKLSSTLPPAVRVLSEEIMMNGEATQEEYGGYLRMRWPKKVNGRWTLTPKEEMPHFSKEQYSEEFREETGHFTLSVIKKLGMDFNPREVVTKGVTSILQGLEDRIKMVEEGHRICQQEDCSEGTLNYEDYSTPSRDKRLGERFGSVTDAALTLSALDPELISFLNEELNRATFTVLGVTKSLKEYQTIFNLFFYSSDPSDSLAERWALDPETIRGSLEKKAKKLFSKRDQFLEESQACLKAEDCPLGSPLWERFNTHALDQELKFKIYLASKNLCAIYHQCEFSEATLSERIKRIPFLISDPGFEEMYRNGFHIKEFYTLPRGNKTFQLEGNIFVIDNALYNLALGNPPVLRFDNAIYSRKYKKLIYNLNNKMGVYSLESGEGHEYETSENFVQMAWLSQHEIFVTTCPEPMGGGDWEVEVPFRNPSCRSEIWKFSGETLSRGKTYESSMASIKYNGFYDEALGIVQMPDGQKIVLLKQDAIETRAVEMVFDEFFTIQAKTTHGLVIRTDEKYGLIQNDQLSCTFELSEGYLVNADIVTDILIHSEEDDQTYYQINEKCELRKLGEVQGYVPISQYGKSIFYTTWGNTRVSLNLYRDGEFSQISLANNERVVQLSEDELILGRYSSNYQVLGYVSLNLHTGERKNISQASISYKCNQTSFCIDPKTELSMHLKDGTEPEMFYLVKKDGLPFFSHSIKHVVNGMPLEASLIDTYLHSGSVINIIQGEKIYIPHP